MMKNCPRPSERYADAATRLSRIRCRSLVQLALLTLLQTAESFAGTQLPGEQPTSERDDMERPGVARPDVARPDVARPDVARPAFYANGPITDAAILKPRSPVATAMIPLYQPAQQPETKIFPTHEFRQRGRSVLENETPTTSFDDAPMMGNTTVWQRLTDYRSRDRVRLLTLWETAGSTVSLLAGTKGQPSLQWTSRLMNRGGATRGLLDHFFSTSLASANRTLHGASRNTDSPKLPDAGNGAGK